MLGHIMTLHWLHSFHIHTHRPRLREDDNSTSFYILINILLFIIIVSTTTATSSPPPTTTTIPNHHPHHHPTQHPPGCCGGVGMWNGWLVDVVVVLDERSEWWIIGVIHSINGNGASEPSGEHCLMSLAEPVRPEGALLDVIMLA